MKKHALWFGRIVFGFAGLLALICGLAVLPVQSRADPDEALTRSLAEFTPETISPEGNPLSFTFLSGGRLLVIHDQLTIVDLKTMKAAAEAAMPDSISEKLSEEYALFDRVHPLNSGFAWLVNMTPRAGGETPPIFFYFQYDDDLKLVQEANLSEALPSDFGFGPGSIAPDPDGSKVYYVAYSPEDKGEKLLAGKIPLDPDSDRLIYQTDRSPDSEFHVISDLRLLNGGKRLCFVGGKLDITGEVGDTIYAYGSMSTDGSDLTILDPTTLQDPYEFYQVGAGEQNVPQSSPIMLLTPNDPKPTWFDDPENYVFTPPPVKSFYAWNVETGDITEIPLRASMEDHKAALSENGKYLATAAADDPMTEVTSLTVRLYDTSNGELLMEKNYSGLTAGFVPEISVSESDKLIRAVLLDKLAYSYTEIPIE